MSAPHRPPLDSTGSSRICTKARRGSRGLRYGGGAKATPGAPAAITVPAPYRLSPLREVQASEGQPGAGEGGAGGQWIPGIDRFGIHGEDRVGQRR